MNREAGATPSLYFKRSNQWRLHIQVLHIKTRLQQGITGASFVQETLIIVVENNVEYAFWSHSN